MLVEWIAFVIVLHHQFRGSRCCQKFRFSHCFNFSFVHGVLSNPCWPTESNLRNNSQGSNLFLCPSPQRKEVIHQFPRTNHALRASRLLPAKPTHFRMFQSDTLLLVMLDCDHITTKLGLHFVRLWAHYSCCLLHFSLHGSTLW